MFEDSNPKNKSIFSLSLGTPANRLTSKLAKTPTPKPDAKADVKPVVPQQVCIAQFQTPETALVYFAGAHRKFQDLIRTGTKPEIVFFVVFPQQGLSHSITTPDGLKTIVPLFTSKPMTEAYITARKLPAVVAACRTENLPQQAEKWIASGINAYALNVCCRCLALSFFPISELSSADLFLSTWRLDHANRRQFGEGYGRNAAAVLNTNRKQARIFLEGIRDHIDPANPYLHWMIALLAGLDGDMEANAASIKRLESFGPPFLGKLQGTSFDFSEPTSQVRTMPEATLGLGISLGYLDPAKMAQPPKQPKE